MWQEAWDPMPWDECRRTVLTETQGHRAGGCGRFEAAIQCSNNSSRRNKWAGRQQRYREYQIHFYGSPIDKEMKK